jgi:hypothetical protein
MVQVARQQVQSGDKRKVSRGCWLEPGQTVSGLTSPLTARIRREVRHLNKAGRLKNRAGDDEPYVEE